MLIHLALFIQVAVAIVKYRVYCRTYLSGLPVGVFVCCCQSIYYLTTTKVRLPDIGIQVANLGSYVLARGTCLFSNLPIYLFSVLSNLHLIIIYTYLGMPTGRRYPSMSPKYTHTSAGDIYVDAIHRCNRC